VNAREDRLLVLERAKVAKLRKALRNLMWRLDGHFGGSDRCRDWQEQKVARVLLTNTATDGGFARKATDASSPDPTEREAADKDVRRDECRREDIGDECRCAECEARRRAEIERAWETYTERGL